jgi:CRP-like cAMP-binding protein
MDNELASVEQIERVPAEAVLFREGEEAKGAFVIHSGQVELAFASKKGLVRPLRSAAAGNVIGLESIVSNQPHDCTATTATPAKLGFIPKEQLTQLLQDHPSTWFTVLKFLCEDVNSCWDSMRTLAVR